MNLKSLNRWSTFDRRFFIKRKVPADSYFVLGDNRRNSKDGRVIGFIHKKDILGEVKFVMCNSHGLVQYQKCQNNKRDNE